MDRLKELSSFNYINLDLERHWKRKTHSCLMDGNLDGRVHDKGK